MRPPRASAAPRHGARDLGVVLHVERQDGGAVVELLGQLAHLALGALALVGQHQALARLVELARDRPRDAALVRHADHQAGGALEELRHRVLPLTARGPAPACRPGSGGTLPVGPPGPVAAGAATATIRRCAAPSSSPSPSSRCSWRPRRRRPTPPWSTHRPGGGHPARRLAGRRDADLLGAGGAGARQQRRRGRRVRQQRRRGGRRSRAGTSARWRSRWCRACRRPPTPSATP